MLKDNYVITAVFSLNYLQAINNSFNGHGQNDSRIPVPFTSFEMDVAVAIYAIGGMFGALPAGFLADLVGR